MGAGYPGMVAPQMMHGMQMQMQGDVRSPTSPTEQFSPFGPVVYGGAQQQSQQQMMYQQQQLQQPRFPQQGQQQQYSPQQQQFSPHALSNVPMGQPPMGQPSHAAQSQAPSQQASYGAMQQSISQSSMHSSRTQHSPSLAVHTDISPKSTSGPLWNQPTGRAVGFSPFDKPITSEPFMDLYGRFEK